MLEKEKIRRKRLLQSSQFRNQVMNSEFSFDVTSEEVEKLEKERHDLEEKWKKFNKEPRPRSLESQLNELELPDLEFNL